MSTPATMVIEVRPKDIGKLKKCNPDLIHLRTKQDLINMYKQWHKTPEDIEEYLKYEPLPTADSFKKKAKRVRLSPYIAAYHHWDGFPENMAEELLTNYNDYDSALNLILAGSFSTIQGGSIPHAAVPEKWGECSWEDLMPCGYNKCPDILYNFQYLFKNGRWYYREVGNKRFKILKIKKN